MWRRITTIVVIAITVVIITYDIIAIIFGGPSATVSSVMRDAPVIIVFAAGVIVGHFWWPNTK